MDDINKIGFYTLSQDRIKNLSENSPLMRGELIITSRCNFNCPYCRGVKNYSRDCIGNLDTTEIISILDRWIHKDGLKNLRLSGGEPTLHPDLLKITYKYSKYLEHFAISTNGSRTLQEYKNLVNYGVNDFSISLDACCSSFADKMAGISGQFDNIVNNIQELSKISYVTVGIVLTEETKNTIKDIIIFAHNLGVNDIRIITAAQYNKLIDGLNDIPEEILNSHPILKYRVNNLLHSKNVRGISETDCRKCYIVLDDIAAAGQWHWPCVIHMREGGEPIGKITEDYRTERANWHKTHDTFSDPICRENCLDCLVDYNNLCEKEKTKIKQNAPVA